MFTWLKLKSIITIYYTYFCTVLHYYCPDDFLANRNEKLPFDGPPFDGPPFNGPPFAMAPEQAY